MSVDDSRPVSEEGLRAVFGDRLRVDVPLAAYTSARIGGPAEYLLDVRSADELADAATKLWEMNVRFRVLGGGSNVLVADKGVRGVIVLNQARGVSFTAQGDEVSVTAESGAAFGSVARRTADRGFSGLEWASTIPGTVGGAVVGNAGAHGSDVAGTLIMAEILQHDVGREYWSPERLEYAYRDSWLKRNPGVAVVLTANFLLERSTKEQVRARLSEYRSFRKQTQPKGASWGSMFKNPLDDHAGRLIEAAGLKGLQHGSVQISQQHANFFLNLGGAKADDAWQLIKTVKQEVARQHGIELELEVELLGDWGAEADVAEGGQG